jgi:hypothetical protein
MTGPGLNSFGVDMKITPNQFIFYPAYMPMIVEIWLKP